MGSSLVSCFFLSRPDEQSEKIPGQLSFVQPWIPTPPSSMLGQAFFFWKDSLDSRLMSSGMTIFLCYLFFWIPKTKNEGHQKIRVRSLLLLFSRKFQGDHGEHVLFIISVSKDREWQLFCVRPGMYETKGKIGACWFWTGGEKKFVWKTSELPGQTRDSTGAIVGGKQHLPILILDRLR